LEKDIIAFEILIRRRSVGNVNNDESFFNLLESIASIKISVLVS